VEGKKISDADTVLVRYGEIGVKSSYVRRKMEDRLRDNLEGMLRRRGVDARVERYWSRILVRTETPYEAGEVVRGCFGVASASECVTCSGKKGEVVEEIVTVAEEVYGGEGSFAVRVNRASGDGEHAFTSVELEEEAGAAVEGALGAPVDLDSPDYRFFAEVRDDEAFVFLEKPDGPGGLPLGTQEPLVALVSGGIDSPVATWRAMRRGSPVVPVYVDLGEYGGVDHEARAFEAMERLADYTPGGLEPRRVDGEGATHRLIEEVNDTRMLSHRRFMLRAAEEVANEVGAAGVVTGEVVGQKSSQTTRNLAVVNDATDLLVHRPLLTFDKPEIVEEARRIGTYESSKVDAGCVEVAPANPETSATLSEVRDAEPDDILELAAEAGRNATVEEVD